MSALKSLFFNLKIQDKLSLIVGIFILLVASLVAFSVNKFNSIEQNYIRLANEPQLRLTHLSDAVRSMSTIRRCVLTAGYLALSDTVTANAYWNEYLAAADQFELDIGKYHENLVNDPYVSEQNRLYGQETVAALRERFTEYRRYADTGYTAVRLWAGDISVIEARIVGGIPSGDLISGKLDSLRMRVFNNMQGRSEDLKVYTSSANDTVVIFSVSILALAMLMSLYMPRVIKEPIQNMQVAMREISKGNLTYPIRSAVKDELGQLSNSIADMVDNIAALNKHVTILNNMDQLICVTDLDFTTIFLNQAAADFYEVDRDGSVGMKCYQALYRSEKPCFYCPLPGLLPYKETLPTCEWEEPVESKGKWLACRTSIIRWLDGNLVQVCMGRDNTVKRQQDENQAIYAENMRKAAEAAKEASRAKSVFLATMSHEIRTPMNGIVGFSELALDDDISQKTRDYLEKIKASSEGLLKIINDILDISKIEAGKVSLENIPFDIHEVLRTCQTVITPKALEKGITLFCYTEPSIHGRLLGDPTRLRQALLNLLSNAVKFTHTGMVKFLTSISESDDESVTIHFEVKDSGIGMTQEQVTRVFEPFAQADTSMTRKYGGTGLGLPITKNIIELMGGTLDVESAPGVGSKFCFNVRFKIIDMDGAVVIPMSEEIHVLEKPMFKGEVLVCEDNVMNQQVISDHLSRVGLTTVIASDGREGVGIVRRRMAEKKPPFDLIFMDVHMPVMDGLEAARKLTVIGNMTPIVALTANVMPTDRDIYKHAGMPLCLAKPYTANDLWGCLLKYLTPVAINTISESEQMQADEKMRLRLHRNFWEDNQMTMADISSAIKTGDIKRAHRLAHTLKGVAGMIGKITLRDAAFAVEQGLRYDKADVTQEQLSRLGFELGAVMGELARTFAQSGPGGTVARRNAQALDRETALNLLRRLEPMLRVGNSDCIELIEELRGMRGTDALIDCMEHYNFKAANEMLAGIKQKLEGTENG
ncbi:MAG: ATP-binding protein [Chitinispirillia bacterium]|nr:ATP-binding protein [Chitinispirillia bacterium]MCL2268835.1 ATP-binding protein [Chitinispirillia bacterium]